MEKKTGRLFLLPNYLDESNKPSFIAEINRQRIAGIKWFIIESHKSARFLLKDFPIDLKDEQLHFDLLNEHSKRNDIDALLFRLLSGEDACIISDAGIPCVADPGSQLVERAQQNNIAVIPLPGASSLFMALMASGFDGQRFSFNGYLSFDMNHRKKQIKEMERLARSGSAQIFMEAPYRNQKLLDMLIQTCLPDTYLCIAYKISSAEEWIKTKTMIEWRKINPEINKQNVVFIIGSIFK